MPLILSALVLAGMQTAPVRIEPGWDGRNCGVRVDDAPMTMEQLTASAPGWYDTERAIEIRVDKEIPYRCAGAVILVLQTEGLRARFVSGFSVVQLAILPGPCHVAVNGKPVSLSRLPGETRKWKKDAEIHFEPDPRAEAACVDRVLKIVKASGRGRLGFVGNGLAE